MSTWKYIAKQVHQYSFRGNECCVECIVLRTRCITRVPIERQYAALQNVGPSPGYYSGFMATTDCAVVVITIIIITIIVRNGNNNIIELWNRNGVGRTKNGGLTAAREMRQKNEATENAFVEIYEHWWVQRRSKRANTLPRLSLFFNVYARKYKFCISIFSLIPFFFSSFCVFFGFRCTLGHTRFRICRSWGCPIAYRITFKMTCNIFLLNRVHEIIVLSI